MLLVLKTLCLFFKACGKNVVACGVYGVPSHAWIKAGLDMLKSNAISLCVCIH